MVTRLKRSADAPAPRRAAREGWEFLTGRFLHARDHLNLYVSELHGEHPAGLSVFKAMEGLLSAGGAGDVPLEPPEDSGPAPRRGAGDGPSPPAGVPSGADDPGWGGFPYRDRKDLEELAEALERAARLLAPVRDLLGTPLLSPGQAAWTPALELALSEAAGRLVRLAEGIASHAPALSPWGLEPGEEAMGDLANLRCLGALLAPPPGVGRPEPAAPPGVAGEGYPPGDLAAAAGLERVGASLRSLWKVLAESPEEGPGAGPLARARSELEGSLGLLAPLGGLILSLTGLDPGRPGPDPPGGHGGLPASLSPLFAASENLRERFPPLMPAVGRLARAAAGGRVTVAEALAALSPADGDAAVGMGPPGLDLLRSIAPCLSWLGRADAPFLEAAARIRAFAVEAREVAEAGEGRPLPPWEARARGRAELAALAAGGG
ncbi:MAG: hypothetical protein LBG06_05040, partial [Deltaproteobacteria bacterium]|nr:hypothetical protein [Deltaproteobacteria bacterium]